ncbi:MAG: hypothetical protein JXR39_08755 [Marinilabiliaceae bacterium]|nr:hypothetical protein [Marinilabiliaceae bacterium]
MTNHRPANLRRKIQYNIVPTASPLGGQLRQGQVPEYDLTQEGGDCGAWRSVPLQALHTNAVTLLICWMY